MALAPRHRPTVEANRVTELIEDGLEADHIDAGELARTLHMSEHHFGRMFSTLAEIPVSEYIRRRRMTVSLNVDAGLWAVFSNEGPFPEAMQQMWAAAGTEWFPANPYEWADGPEILRVADLDVEAGTCRGELWLPITPAC